MKHVISLTTFHTSVIFGFTPESLSTNSQDTVFDTSGCRKNSYLLVLAITLGDQNEAYLVWYNDE